MMFDPLSSVTLRQLKTFAAVAHELSFVRAADALDLSQPAISEQIKLLEQVLGTRLLDRTPGRRRVILTEAGKVLLRGYEDASQTLERTVRELEALRGLERGRVRFGAGECFGTYVLPKVHADFRASHDGITVQVEVDRNHHLLERLAQGQLDLAVVVEPISQRGITSEPLAGFDIVVIGPPNHRLANRPMVQLEELAREPWILPDDSALYRTRIDQMAAAAGFQLKVIMEINVIETRLQAVAAGQGIGTVSTYSLMDKLSTGRVGQLFVEGFPMRVDWFIAYQRGQVSPAAQAFKTHLLQYRSLLEKRDLTRA